jgi:hypothetical protein
MTGAVPAVTGWHRHCRHGDTNAGQALAFLAFFHECGIFGLVKISHAPRVPPKLMGMTTSVHRRQRACRVLFAATLALPLAAQAQTAVYKCVDDRGRVEFTDTSKKGCKLLDLPGASATVPAARAPLPATRLGSAPRPAATTSTPASFPRVDSAQQRARDDDRREILNQELRAEEKKLADLKREFNNGEPERQGNERNYAKYQERVAQMRDDIGRAERNIEALKREIANIR